MVLQSYSGKGVFFMISKIRMFVTVGLLACMFPIASVQGESLFKITTALPAPRQMYGAVVLGDYLYVVGGNNQAVGDDPEGYVKSVMKALVNPDGTLGPWQETTPLPENRSYISNSTLAMNDIVYVVMGKDGQKNLPTKTIYWTRPLPNGHLEPWRESAPYPGEGLQMVTAVATPGYINIIGGLDINKAVRPEVWSARIGADGAIEGWEQGPALPIGLYFHASGVAGGRVWVWAGYQSYGAGLNEKVYSAPVLSAGKIGSWGAGASTLPKPFYNPAAAVSGNFLLTFCPRYTREDYSSEVWFAQVYEGGAIGPWQSLVTGMDAKLYTAVATDYRRNFVYMPGGRIYPGEDENCLDPRVYYFQLANQATDTVAEAPASAGASGEQNLSYTRNDQTAGAFPGFLPYQRGRETAQSKAFPQLLYFHSNAAAKCLQQAQIINTFNTASFPGVIFAEAGIKDYPQIAQQYGVFRVPCWIMFNRRGDEVGRRFEILDAAGIQNAVSLASQ